MNTFDLLALAYLGLAIVALYGLRLCVFIFASNNVLVCRALSAIDRSGCPASITFLPEFIFSSDNLQTASTIMSICLVTLALATLLPGRPRIRIGPDAPAVPPRLLAVLVLYFVTYAFSTKTIFTAPYVSEQSRNYEFELAGAHALLCSLVLYELARRRLLALITARKSFLIMFLLFTATGYARGGTGLTTGYLITAAILFLPRTGAAKKLTNVARIVAVMLVVFAVSFIVRSTRHTMATDGISSLSSALNDAMTLESERDTRGEGAETVANASQSAIHMLLTITLYDSGISREWRSIYNVVQYTFMPSFLLVPFDWQRPIEPAWELASHYVHGGGINVLGEFYWNGGFLCVIIMCSLLCWFCYVVDKHYRASPFWLMMACQFAPSFLMGYGYGFPQVARGAINGLLVALTYRLLVAVHALKAAVPEPPTPSGTGPASSLSSLSRVPERH